MKHPIINPDEDFKRILENSEKLIVLIDNVREYSGKQIVSESYSDEFYKHALVLYNTSKENSLNLVVLIGTLLLYVAGQFEQYIKECMKIVAEDYSNKCKCFDELPAGMQSNLINRTAEIIIHPLKYGFAKDDAKSLINQLSSSLSSSVMPLNINSDCLVITEQNMRPDILNDLLKRFEIKDIWKEISKQSSIKAYLGIEDENEIEKKMKQVLNDLMEDRNAVAHPSSIPIFPDSQKMKNYIEYLRHFAKVFTELMIQKCIVFKPTT